ncbi:MAG: FHA domain-containing protein [Candidatus Riflebacteria bacterium]|nr:FHA domain-containing protein [Candidatus Riflebacteria bacterium]
MNAGLDNLIPGFTETKSVYPSPDKAVLKILTGPGNGRIFPLDKQSMIIGREKPPEGSADLDLSDCELGEIPMISRRHAEIRWAGKNLEIIDLGSLNGTWVDGKKLEPISLLCEPNYFILKYGTNIRFANLEAEITNRPTLE